MRPKRSSPVPRGLEPMDTVAIQPSRKNTVSTTITDRAVQQKSIMFAYDDARREVT